MVEAAPTPETTIAPPVEASEVIQPAPVSQEPVVEAAPSAPIIIEPVAEVPHKSALDRLHDFETKLFGANVMRIAGKIEDGIGSAFSRLHPSHKAHIAALKDLAGAEQAHSDAQQDLADATDKLNAATAATAATEAASSTAN